MEEEVIEKPSYYAILPANVRYDRDLQPMARLLYAEISCLTNMTGICTASNEYFSSLFEVAPVTVSRIISKLKDKGYIEINYVVFGKGDERKERREIKLVKSDTAQEPIKPKIVKKEKEEEELFEYSFIKMPKPHYDKLIEEYGKEFIKETMDRMIEWCNNKRRYYKDYNKSIRAWLQGAPKLTDKVPVEEEVYKPPVEVQEILFDIQ